MISAKSKRRALISVYDKTGIIDLAAKLINAGYEIIASGGSAQTLSDAGVVVTTVESVTGSVEILGGRVKTLHPAIHGAILADLDRQGHLDDLKTSKIDPIDLVIINLYPFEKVLASQASHDEIIENIDIGGSALLRASAKNYKHITVISSITQYQLLIEGLSQPLSLEQRRMLAGQAFVLSNNYESAIASWFNPEKLELNFIDPVKLRYGENPHQAGMLYKKVGNFGLANAQQLHGKEMSFNNYLDADAAFRAAHEHNQSAIAIIKHAIPCGIALGADSYHAYKAALECDPISAFGGVVGSNSIITAQCALAISDVFTEVIIAPDYEEKALEILVKKANLRILKIGSQDRDITEIRAISGGLLLQERDLINHQGDLPVNWQHVAGPKASSEALEDLEFAWRAIRSLRSNAILIAKNQAAIGIGAGQVNRLNSAQLAVSAASKKAEGAVAASDAFFPFADGLEVLIKAGVCALVQPGGSKRDEEVIATAVKAGLTMYFTGIRHFSHQ